MMTLLPGNMLVISQGVELKRDGISFDSLSF